MLNKLLGDFINGAISAHTSQIRNQDVSLKLFQNSINITELELYKFALFQYDFPIVIKCGIIKNIKIIVPWATFQTDEVKITIDDIFILATFPGENPINFITDQDLHDIREHQLAAHHEFAKKFYKILKQISSQKLEQIAKRVLHSCSIEIKNLHVRIEIDDDKSNACHSFGFITSSINVFTKKPSKGIPSIIEKSVNLNDLAVYLDLDQNRIQFKSIEEFISIMKNLSKIELNHHFLLEPSLISAKLTSSTEKKLYNFEILTDLNDIVLSISKKQLPIILKMASNVKKFNQFMFIKKCQNLVKLNKTVNSFHNKRNDTELNNSSQANNFNSNKNDDNKEDDQIEYNNSIDNDTNVFDPLSYWLFIHTLAKKKNNSKLDSFLDRILYHNKYVKEWNGLRKKSSRTPLLVMLDHKLDYQAILYFQAFSEAIKDPLHKLNHDEIQRFVNFDPLLFIPSFVSLFSVKATSSKMTIKLINQDESFDCRIILGNTSFNLGKKHFHVILNSIEIVCFENSEKNDVLKMTSPHQNNIISIDAIFESFSNASFKIVSQPMNFSVELYRIFNLVSYLDLNVKDNRNNRNLFEKIQIEKNNYKVDVDLSEIHLIPFVNDNVFFDFCLKSFKMHQNQLNSKEYFVLFNDISLSHNNFYIFEKLNICSSTIHGIMNVKIPYFSINLMEKNFEKLFEVKRFFESISMLSQKVPLDIKNIKIDLDGIDIYSDLLKNKINLSKLEMIYLNDLYKSIFKINFSKIEIGYVVVEDLDFKLKKKPGLIRSILIVNHFYIKEIKINVKSDVPLLKGTYNLTEETMNLNLGIESIEIEDYSAIKNLESFSTQILSLFQEQKSDSQIISPTNNSNNNDLNDSQCHINNSVSSSQINDTNENQVNSIVNQSNSNDLINFEETEKDEKTFLKSLLDLIGNKELKIPKLNLTIHFIPKPITVIYNDLIFYIEFECSILFNPFVFTLSIPVTSVTYKSDKYFELNNFAFIFSEQTGVNISSKSISLNITDKMIEKVKHQYELYQPLMNQITKIIHHNSNKEIPNIQVNIQFISIRFLKLFTKYSIKVPFSQLSIFASKKKIDLKTDFYVKCSNLGIKTEPINLSLIYNSIRNNQTIELQILNQVKVNFSPLKLKKFISSKNVFYTNQTGIELSLIIDEKTITIPNNSSFIGSQFPKKSKICFLTEKSKTFFDTSRLWGEQSIPAYLNSGMILVRKLRSTIIFSSPIEILNTTGFSIQLLDECFQNYILPNNQNFFVPPEIESKMKTLSISILGTKIKIKAKLLEKPYTIHMDDSEYFRFIIERNSTTLVARITITSTMFLQSNFSEPLSIEFQCKSGHKNYVLYPLIKVPICLYDINSTKLVFKLSSYNENGYFNNNAYNVNIPLLVGESMLPFLDSKHRQQKFYLRCRITEDNSIKTIELSAPMFIVNQLGLSVMLSLTDNDKKILSDFNSQHLPKNQSLFRPIWHLPHFKYNINPYCYVKDEEVSFFLSYPITMKFTKSKFGVSRINSKELALLPTNKINDKVMPVTFQVIHDEETNIPTIVLKPYVIIFNNTNQSIGVDGNILEMSNYLIVRSVLSSLNVTIYSSGLNIPINLEYISDFSVSGPSLHCRIQFYVSFVDEIKYITVSNINSLGLFAVINETDKDFFFNQTTLKDFQYFALSQSSFLFDLSDTRTECSIELFSENISPFIVQLDHPMDMNPIPSENENDENLFYSVDIVGKDNRYVVHLYQKSSSFLIDNNYDLKVNFLMTIPMVSLKLLGNLYREYCRVTFGLVSFHVLQQNKKESLALSIESIQIDDMNEFTDHPVVLLSTKKPFLNIGLLKTIKSSFYEYLICNITPVAAEIDISFIIDMISLFEMKGNQPKLKQEETNLNKNTNFHCLLLKILPIDADLSFFTRTPRQFHRFEPEASIPKFLSIIPTIENFHLQISPMNAVDLLCSQKEFLLILLDNAKSSFSTQWLNLIGSAAIIGNPQKLIYNFSSAFKKPAKQIPKELLIGTADSLGSLLKTSELTLKGISSTFRSVSNDDSHFISDNKTALGGFSWGLKSFVSGFAKAATGIVTKPIERAKESGFTGALQGAGEGIVGIVTNSVGGAVDLTAGIITGVRRGIFGENIPKRIEEPVPKHRAYIKEMDDFIGIANLNLDSSAKKIVFIFFSNEADISEDEVFIGEKVVKIDDINGVVRLENSKIVKIDTRNQSDEIIIEFEKEKIAKKFNFILQIQIERKMTQKMFSIPYSL